MRLSWIAEPFVPCLFQFVSYNNTDYVQTVGRDKHGHSTIVRVYDSDIWDIRPDIGTTRYNPSLIGRLKICGIYEEGGTIMESTIVLYRLYYPGLRELSQR